MTRYTSRVRRGFALIRNQQGSFAATVEKLIAHVNRLGQKRADRYTASECADLRAMGAWMDQEAARVEDAPDCADETLPEGYDVSDDGRGAPIEV